MARMYPRTIDVDAPDSEKSVFSVLEKQLPGDWIVFYSLRYMRPATEKSQPAEGEGDFLIIDPKRGFIVLEVKGGSIRKDEYGWISKDRFGHEHRIKDPGEQAQRNAHQISKLLSNQAPFNSSGQQVRYGWGVAFPNSDIRSSLGPELPRELVLDREDLKTRAREGVDRIFDAHRVAGRLLDQPRQQALLRILSPSFDLVVSLASRIDDDDPVLIRLTEEQMYILDALPDVKRVGVNGPAGTGKTLVAMEKARRLAGSGKRVLFLCFNEPLATFLSGRTDGFTVETFHKLCRRLATSASLNFKPPHDSDEAREFWETEAPQLLEKALDVYPDERWDAVIIDEGQDFKELWWLVIEKLLKDEHGILWVFFDRNQNIYGGGPIQSLGLVPASLQWNCRNTAAIAKHSAKRIDQSPKLKPGTPEGIAVEVVDCRNPKEMCDAVSSALHRLIIEGKLSSKQVIVLSPYRPETSSVFHQRKFGNFRLVEFPEPAGPNEVQFATLTRFKGLEADAVILCEVKKEAIGCSPQHLYVASSRAKHALIVAEYV